MTSPDTLPDVLEAAFDRLDEGVRRRQDPFHQGVLSTQGADGPKARYLVLRGFDRARGVVTLHSDRRSDKLAQLAADPRASYCLFGDKLQLRLEGRVRIHLDDAEADAAWARTGMMARRTYLVDPAPGSVLEEPGGGLPGDLAQHAPDPERSEAGRQNFALLALHLERVEWLSLAATGHRRARFVRGDGKWNGDWLAP